MNVSELLAELPGDGFSGPVPSGSLQRLWGVSELSVQIGLAYAVRWVRQWFSSADSAERQLMETNLRVGVKLFDRLGYMRGAMAKLGQAAGNLPLVVPAQIAETLDRLHFEALPMHYPLIREVLRNEFGKDAEDLFLAFDKSAFAAASLGQVHRGVLKSGEQAAVKIQYPGIARTIEADFRNLSALLLPLRLGKDWESAKAQFEEVRRMLNQEVDYVQEADSTERVRELFGSDDGIVVPRVYREYSAKRVLTTEYIPGLHLRDYLATNPDQASRNAFGTKLYVAWHRMYYAFMPYGDPHPGNYLFLSDGRLGLLDFGCVRYFGPEEREIMMLADRMAFEDNALTKEVTRRTCGVSEDDPAWADYLGIMEGFLDWTMEPAARPGPFDFGDQAHFRRGLELFSLTVRKKLTRANPMYGVYWNRSIFGLKAMLYRLRAQVDAGAVIRQERLLLNLQQR